MEKSCTEIMQHFGFYSEYYIPETEKLDFHLPHFYTGKHYSSGKQHAMFVSQHNNFDLKRHT